MPDPAHARANPAADAAPAPDAARDGAADAGLRRRRVARRVRAATRQLVDSAEDLAGALGDAVVGTAGDAITDTLVPKAEALAQRVVTRQRRYRLRRHPELQPLPNLYRVHPEARLAPVRELGLSTIPVDEIVGTAVEGIDQRGQDFKPLGAFRSTNWEARWQRLKKASDRLASLPPIDVLKTPEGYWVVDGHNRVAVAKANGQIDIDADVKAVILPGQGPVRPAGPLAPVLVDSAGLTATRRPPRRRRPKPEAARESAEPTARHAPEAPPDDAADPTAQDAPEGDASKGNAPEAGAT